MESPVLLFDGVCNLCNGLVRFILRHEKSGVIRFAPLQSEYAARVLKEFKKPGEEFNTLVFFDQGLMFTRSSAVFRIAAYLRLPWSAVRIFRILPVAFNDLVYKLISKYRYHVFGKKDRCMTPPAKWKSRFIG